MKKDKAIIDIEVKNDGVYLNIVKPRSNNFKLTFVELKLLIEQYGVQDWDFDTVNMAAESIKDKISVRISSNTELKAVNENILVHIAKDKMSATITFFEPKNQGKMLTKEDVIRILNENKVTFGIYEDLIDELIQKRQYGIAIEIAKGVPSQKGNDGFVKYSFNIGRKSHKPKELEDGSVDYYEIDLFDVAEKDMVLATIVPPTEGIHGKTVLSEELKTTDGRPAKVLLGKNVHMDEEGFNVISDIDGQILFTGGKISVEPVLEIKGNVDNSTGNINFLGSVIVTGNVVTGFSINATGDVDINGVVEGAIVHSEGNVFIKGGIQGLGKGNVHAGGSITAKYVEHCTLFAKGDLNTDAIMHSDVKCNGTISVAGKKGLIVGGKVRALQLIESYTIGSHMATSTEVHVGIDPETFDRYNEYREQFAEKKKELQKLDQAIDLLAKLKEAGQLTEERRNSLIKALQSKSYLTTKINELNEKIESIKPAFSKGAGTIKVKQKVLPGVKIIIGNAVLYAREDINSCTLYNKDGDISIGPY